MPLTFDLRAHAYAHRGLWGADLPENSAAAFRAAADLGFGAECDVHLSADGVPMVFHDFTLDRMTTLTGSVSDLSAEALGRTQLAGSGETIPTLSDVLTAMGDNPLLIELKVGQETDLFALAAQTLSVIAEHETPVTVMSFSPEIIAICKQISSNITLGLLAAPDRLATPEGRAGFGAIAEDLRPDYLGPNVSRLTEMKEIADRLNLPMAAWTVRNEESLRACRENNAAPIFEKMPSDLVRAAART